jgi:hypothetical protein
LGTYISFILLFSLIVIDLFNILYSGDIDKIIRNASDKVILEDSHENHIIVNISNNILTVDNNIFNISDLVVIFSLLSNEEFSGVVTNITNAEIIIRCGSEIGTIFSINLKQIKNRR